MVVIEELLGVFFSMPMQAFDAGVSVATDVRHGVGRGELTAL
jgi:hypothetical protein